MKIAFTSTDGKTVDQHFGMATTFHLFEIGPESSVPAGTVGVVALGRTKRTGSPRARTRSPDA